MPEQDSEKDLELARDPSLLSRINAVLSVNIVGENSNRLLVFLVFASSYSDNPLGIIITGSSSSGKSTLLNRIAKYFPKVHRYSRVTSASLDRLEQNVAHYILIIEELQGLTAAEPTLRIMLSEGGLSLLTTDRDDKGKITTREIKTTGTPAFATTTASIRVDDQLQNRILLASMDETKQQTRQINKMQAQEFSDPDYSDKPDSTLQAFLKTLLPHDVYIPYADDLAELFPIDTIQARRDFPKLLSLIQVIAWMHQHQRCMVQRPDDKLKTYILADIIDLLYALAIAGSSLLQSLLGLQERGTKALEQFTNDCQEHTSRSLASSLRISQDRARELLEVLLQWGYVEKDESQKTHRYIRTMKQVIAIDSLGSLSGSWTGENVRERLEARKLVVFNEVHAVHFIDPFKGLTNRNTSSASVFTCGFCEYDASTEGDLWQHQDTSHPGCNRADGFLRPVM